MLPLKCINEIKDCKGPEKSSCPNFCLIQKSHIPDIPAALTSGLGAGTVPH